MGDGAGHVSYEEYLEDVLLDDNDDTQHVVSNADIDDEVLASLEG